MLELLREVKVEEFVENFKNKELCEILEATIEFNNYRNYYNIDKMGNVKTKSPNEALVKLSLLGNEFLGEYFQKGLFITEKRKIHKIDRLSDFTVEHLEKNLYKIFFNRDINVAYRYVKEFILKDKEFFIKKLSHFVLLNNIDNNKPLIILAFIKALENVNKKNIDSILYSYLPYIVTFPSEISTKEYLEIKAYDIESLDLNELAYLNLIVLGYEEYNKIYFGKLSKYMEEKRDYLNNKELFERLSENKDELYKMWSRA